MSNILLATMTHDEYTEVQAKLTENNMILITEVDPYGYERCESVLISQKFLCEMYNNFTRIKMPHAQSIETDSDDQRTMGC